MSVENPYVHASTRSSLRRSVCDRCRYMKLKCLRDQESPHACFRCLRSGENRLTGPAKSLGRAVRMSHLIPDTPPNWHGDGPESSILLSGPYCNSQYIFPSSAHTVGAHAGLIIAYSLLYTLSRASA